MNQKRIVPLILILLSVGLLAFIVYIQYTQKQQAENRLLLPDLAAQFDTIHYISMERGGTKTRLARGTDGWVVEDFNHYPADDTKINTLLLNLSQLRIVESKTNNPEHLPALALKDINQDNQETARITLFSRDSKTMADILVGKTDSRYLGHEQQYFMRFNGNVQSWLVRGDLSFAPETFFWIEPTIVHLEQARLRQINIKLNNGRLITLLKSTPFDANFKVTEAGGGIKISPEKIQELNRLAEFLRLTDVRERKPLNTKDAIILNFSTFDGVQLTMMAEPSEKGWWVDIETEYNAAPDEEAWSLKKPKDFTGQIVVLSPKNAAQEVKDMTETVHKRQFLIAPSHFAPLQGL
jgi:hypothetical protein